MTEGNRMPNETIELGLYRHYKGDLYVVYCVAHHTETNEAMVVYAKAIGGEFYVRPASMWNDQVGVDDAGQPITRFTRCK